MAFEECGEQSIKTLESIRAQIDVRDLLARHSKTRSLSNMQPPNVSQPVDSSPIPVKQPKQLASVIERKTPTQRVNFHISETDLGVLARMEQASTKVAKQALVLCKQDKINECRSQLPKGVNPFTESGPRFFRIACDMLISGGFTKASLKAKFIEELGWNEGTAGPHVALTVGVLNGFGIVKVSLPDLFILNPELSR
ncbi:hypothetical protein QN372_00025 [Undibacterium sp. RTI2.1]|uniref:hypothetical protein n=2 Tax=Pseudomonadota TaxID=1224 RepID=UPI002AB4F890|nr:MULTISPECIES: hypothetical protein [unclassified Undibacterium]MDY7537526.1 hypothetical protein [Undibacterium sp. 5I1]MEB0029124.1 hypothetical protein [Undibacterium sp. RTI2.1]